MLYVYILHPRLSVYTKALFETTASALGSASGSVLSSEALDEHVRKAHAMVNRGSKLPWAESGAEAVVSKRASYYGNSHIGFRSNPV